MKNKINIITIISVLPVVALLSVSFFIIPDKKLSEKENRTLQQLPAFSASDLFSGEYTADLADYISDQFTARDSFVAIKAYSELLLGKRENNGVIYAENDTLVARDSLKQNRMHENLKTVKEFETATGAQVCLAVLPRSVDVFSEYLPSTYYFDTDRSLWQDFYSTAKYLNLNAPNLYDSLCEQNNYYRTDHHYTSFGAYQTYELLGSMLGYTVYDLSFFETETVSENFCGTSMRTSGFYLTPKDKINLLRYNGDNDYNITADGKSAGLYDKSKLETTDQYAVFLGGNHARVDIKKSGESREKLLIIRDSFADSLAPFLALHYDLIMLDLRYFSENIRQLVKDENINRVLVLESISEFATAKNISYLRRNE